MEFLGNLGIDIKLLAAQMINFGLLLLLLKKFLYNPIIAQIEKDEAELMQVKVQKKELEQQKMLFLHQKELEISKAKMQAQEIIEEAKSVSKEIVKRAKDDSRQERQAVIKQIKSRLSEIEHEKQDDR